MVEFFRDFVFVKIEHRMRPGQSFGDLPPEATRFSGGFRRSLINVEDSWNGNLDHVKVGPDQGPGSKQTRLTSLDNLTEMKRKINKQSVVSKL